MFMLQLTYKISCSCYDSHIKCHKKHIHTFIHERIRSKCHESVWLRRNIELHLQIRNAEARLIFKKFRMLNKEQSLSIVPMKYYEAVLQYGSKGFTHYWTSGMSFPVQVTKRTKNCLIDVIWLFVEYELLALIL